MREILDETPTVSVFAPTWPRPDRVVFSIGGGTADKCAKFPLSSKRSIARLAEQKALSRIAGLLAQVADLRRAFDAFSDQHKPQTLRHSDNGIDQTCAKLRLIEV